MITGAGRGNRRRVRSGRSPESDAPIGTAVFALSRPSAVASARSSTACFGTRPSTGLGQVLLLVQDDTATWGRTRGQGTGAGPRRSTQHRWLSKWNRAVEPPRRMILPASARLPGTDLDQAPGWCWVLGLGHHRCRPGRPVRRSGATSQRHRLWRERRQGAFRYGVQAVMRSP